MLMYVYLLSNNLLSQVFCIWLALGVQDLLDMDQIDEIEWPLGSDDDDEELMEIDA